MWIIIGFLIIIVGFLTVYFNLSYSPLGSEFSNLKQDLSANPSTNEIFTEEDIQNLPEPVQRYFRYCGYLGHAKESYVTVSFTDVYFVLERGSKPIRIDYSLFETVDDPNRIAFIDTTMFGIPFQGLDTYVDGVGGMKGVLGKAITLFNQAGAEMDKACLVTCLSECLILPNMALQDYIAWESIDDTHVKATIHHEDITATGIFAFSKEGELRSFTTSDRGEIGTDGTVTHIDWSMELGAYRDIDDVLCPTSYKTIWHYDDGDFLYFDADNVNIERY